MYAASPGHEQVWISWVDEVLPLYADHPDELLALTAGLERLWFEGAFIGDVLAIAQASRVVRDPRLRSEVEHALREMHGRMRAVQPRLPVIGTRRDSGRFGGLRPARAPPSR